MTDTIQPRNTPLRSSRELLPLIAPARLGSSTWLLLLRWFAVAGQLLTILTAGSLSEVELPYSPLLSLVALTAVTNTLYGIWLYTLKPIAPRNSGSIESGVEVQANRHRDTESKQLHAVALALMLLDLLTLTAMLYFSGGAGNPFSFFYFVNLAVGGVMIRPKAAWSLTVTAIAGYTFLLNYSIPVTGLDIFKPHGFDLQTGGLMLAFATCSSVVTYFVTQTAGELK